MAEYVIQVRRNGGSPKIEASVRGSLAANRYAATLLRQGATQACIIPIKKHESLIAANKKPPKRCFTLTARGKVVRH